LANVIQPASAATLIGTVRDDAGRPIAGANVFISTAAPRKGVGVLCPSCYPDCRKSAVSDGRGRFALSDLDPSLKFLLLVVARGFAPRYSPKHVTPETGASLITLKARDLGSRKPERVVHGRVLNENGDPVARAIVEVDGVRHGRGGRFGALGELGIDALAVTNDNGVFLLGVGEDGDALYLRIKAPFLAPLRTKPLAAGRMVHTITFGPGVTVTGRVTKEGRPLGDVGIGMVQFDRGVEGFLGHFEFGTDRDGRFAFANIPPRQSWYIYGLMDSLKEYGAIPARVIETRAHGSTLKLGDIEVRPGYRLTGRLVLADGRPVPSETRVLASRWEAWDSQMATVGPDGRFSFTGLPAEELRLSPSVRGYRPSAKNASFDFLNRLGLLGTVKGDVDDLRFLLEPGPRPEIGVLRLSGEDHAEYQRRRDGPLRGVAADK
jgi:protocatechuate 3,4-dioxygenase beta subunit